jgi:hypothetical protein
VRSQAGLKLSAMGQNYSLRANMEQPPGRLGAPRPGPSAGPRHRRTAGPRRPGRHRADPSEHRHCAHHGAVPRRRGIRSSLRSRQVAVSCRAATAELSGTFGEVAVKTSKPMCDLASMTGLTGGWEAVASAGAAAVHVLARPYAAVVLSVTAVFRLLAERARRKTLVDLVTRAPVGTIVVMEKGPGGPAMWVRVGGELQVPPRPEVWRGR